MELALDTRGRAITETRQPVMLGSGCRARAAVPTRRDGHAMMLKQRKPPTRHNARLGQPIAQPCGFQNNAAAALRAPKRPQRPGFAPRRRPQWKHLRWLMPIGVLSAFAGLFVGADVLERHLLGDITTGWRHALLTLRAAIVTAAGALTVYSLMRWQHRRLSDTAVQLAQLLEQHYRSPTADVHFENPHLVHCRDVLNCQRNECPMYDSPGERCWQMIALNNSARHQTCPNVDIEQCHECKVYRMSCPETLYELGEAFNNLMFLLKGEAKQVGRMRSQMVEKEKMVAIGQLASGIAHEVCNPLSSISAVVQMLKRANVKGEMKDQLNLIETHIQRISGTVRRLGSLSRPTPERWDLVDIRKTLEGVVRLISFDRRARDVKITLECPETIAPSYALGGQLQQVFLNLGLNALDAMPDGGSLIIRADKARGKTVVTVKDTGMGIARETGRRIFEPFFTTKEPGKGTGLGLSVSYGIVQKHGGTIDYASSVGEGTTFTIQLPILDKMPEI